MTPAKLIYLMLVGAGLALVLVWQDSLARGAGYRVQELRAELDEQRAERAAYLTQLSKLKNPRRITALVAWLGLGLREPPVEPETDRPVGQEQDGAGDTTPARGVAQAGHDSQ